MDSFIILDVGGVRFQGRRKDFAKYPETRLGKLLSTANIEEILTLCDEFVPGNPTEYFFDRNPGTADELMIFQTNRSLFIVVRLLQCHYDLCLCHNVII